MALKKITQKELKHKLKLHDKWCSGLKGGQKANLSGYDLRGANLSGVELTNVDFSRSDLSHAKLVGARLRNASLREANLAHANLAMSELVQVDAESANFSNAILLAAELQHCYFNEARFTSASLKDAKLLNCRFFNAKLSKIESFYVLIAEDTDLDLRVVSLNKHRIVKFKNKIQIGCETNSVNYWLRNYQKVGQINRYTPSEIKQYGLAIKMLASGSTRKRK
jgi:hypothetical protein